MPYFWSLCFLAFLHSAFVWRMVLCLFRVFYGLSLRGSVFGPSPRGLRSLLLCFGFRFSRRVTLVFVLSGPTMLTFDSLIWSLSFVFAFVLKSKRSFPLRVSFSGERMVTERLVYLSLELNVMSTDSWCWVFCLVSLSPLGSCRPHFCLRTSTDSSNLWLSLRGSVSGLSLCKISGHRRTLFILLLVIVEVFLCAGFTTMVLLAYSSCSFCVSCCSCGSAH
jgi:hypothetical protein